MSASGKPFEFREIIRHPQKAVYQVLRDRLQELIPYLPNVESVTITERVETGPGRVRMVNEWHGKPTAAPKIVQPFIKPEMTRWTDYADWDEAASCVHWRFAMPMLNDIFKCEGTNYFVDDPAGTLVRLTGTLTLYPERVPGVPKILARGIAAPLEKWVLGLVSPNLTELPGAVGKFLDQETR